MKKIWSYSFLLFIVSGFFACDNEVQLEGEWQDIPVVYGFLSRKDTASYIRIQKAFLDENGGNALEIAQIGDSLYYDDLDVSIQNIGNGTIYDLVRVLGEDEGFDREEGTFSSDPNYLYKLMIPEGDALEANGLYELQINRGDNKAEITARTKIIPDPIFTAPFQVGPLLIKYQDFPVSWRVNETGVLFDLTLIFHYKENSEEEPNEFTDKVFEWTVVKSIERTNQSSQQVKVDFPGETFYQELGEVIGEPGDGLRRVFVQLDFRVDVAGQELFDYISIGQANTGITSSQVIPTYTNLSEGFGVFSSRNYSVYSGFTLNPESIDTLQDGIHTRHLNFQ